MENSNFLNFLVLNPSEDFFEKFSHPNKKLYKHILEIKVISKKLLEILNVNNEKIDKWLDLLSELHDLGKLREDFQFYIKNEKKKDILGHSIFSFLASLIILYFRKKELNLTSEDIYILLNLIKNHHSNLKYISFKEIDLDILKEDVKKILNIVYPEIKEKFETIWQKIKELKNKEVIGNKIKDGIFKELTNGKVDLEDYLLTLFTFGVFLFSDRLSAFITEDWKDKKELNSIVDKLFEEMNIKSAYSEIDYSKFWEFMEKLQKNNQEKEINKLRTQAFKEVNENFEKNKNKKIFKITLPTGLGKTLTGLNIALKLNKELKRPIIYSLPYLSIIEQNYQVIENIFNKNNNEIVGKFHHLTIFDNNEDKTSLREFVNFELKPITITTFIQIFHSIFTNDRNWVIKFPFIATSILIIDETQNLRVSCFDAFDKILLKMTELFGTNIILMSATQPYLLEKKEKSEKDFEWFNNTLKENKVELVANKKEYYQFNRYKVIIEDNLFDENGLNLNELIDKIINKLQERKKVGIIANKVGDSIEIFNKLDEKLNFKELSDSEINNLIKEFDLNKEKLEINKIEKLEKNISNLRRKLGLSESSLIKNEFKDLNLLLKNNLKKFNLNGEEFYLLYLSANLINLEKKLRSNLLKKLENKNLLVISTQVIEAGIDISLNTIFRFIAPLDSIIQSAGRVNRNGFRDLKGELILICDLDKNKKNDEKLWKHVYDSILINKTKDFLLSLIKEHSKKEFEEIEITEPEKIENYFKSIRESKNDKTCVKCENSSDFVEDTIKTLNFECIGKFSLIEDKPQYHLILDLDFNILRSFNEVYNRVGEINDKKEKLSYLRKIKDMRKIEEFFKATRIGKLNLVEDMKKNEGFKFLVSIFEKENLFKIKESIKEIEESDFNYEEIIFNKEKKDYFKTKEGKIIKYYDFFGFSFFDSQKNSDNKFKKSLKEKMENFIID